MKKILLLFGVLLLTGCSVNYNLKIDNEGMHDEITGNISKNEFDVPGLEGADLFTYELLYLEQPAIVDSDEYYETDIDDSGEVVNFKYSYDYNGNFKKARILNSCYDNVVFKETSDFYIIELNGDFNCLYTNEIELNVTTDFPVIKSNANKIAGNTYTWYLTKDSTDIELQVYKVERPVSEGENINYITLIGLIVFVILCLVALGIYLKRKNKNN